MVLGGILWAVSLLLFAATGSLLAVFFILILMGITEGFAAPAQNDYFLDMPVSKSVGEDAATACFELFGKVGETIGPMAFATAMLLGKQTGMLALAVIIVVLLVPVLVFLRPSTHAG